MRLFDQEEEERNDDVGIAVSFYFGVQSHAILQTPTFLNEPLRSSSMDKSGEMDLLAITMPAKYTTVSRLWNITY